MLWGQPSFLTKPFGGKAQLTQLCTPQHLMQGKARYSRLQQFSTKYKLIVHCEVFGVGGIDFLPKQFWYLIEEKNNSIRIGRGRSTKKNHIIDLPQGYIYIYAQQYI